MVDRGEARRRRRTQRLRRRVAGGAVACAVVAAGLVTWQLARSSSPSYRLAAVRRTDIAQILRADGTVSVSDQGAALFATQGTVARVLVGQGAHVHAGQALATLELAPLTDAVSSAQQRLASARQTLADDEAAQAGVATAAVVSAPAIMLAAAVIAHPSSSPQGPGAGHSTSPASGAAGSSGASAVQAAQRQVVAAVQALDTAIAAEDANIATAAARCSSTQDGTAVTVPAQADASGAVSGTVGGQAVTATLLDPSGSVDTTTSSANPQQVPAGGRYSFAGLATGSSYEVGVLGSDKTIDTAACTAAIATVTLSRRSVDAALQRLDPAVSALTAAVQSLPSSRSGGGSGGSSGGSSGTAPPAGRSGAGASGAPSRGGGGSSAAGGGSGGRASGGGSGATPSGSVAGSGTAGGQSRGPVTAQQVVADQKAIDAARLRVEVARRNRALATLTAPISGTVDDVSVRAGQSVGTSTSAMTIVGSSHKLVTVDIGIASIDLVKPGQRAQVIVDGRTRPITGTVSRIGLLDVASDSTSTASYAVTIDLARAADAVYDGTGASVAITVATAAKVLAVPLSAVTGVGSLHTVRVYSGGRALVTPVSLGVVGADDVQIVRGLTSGQRVVLADLGAAIPTSTVNRFGFGGGGLGGGGLGGGGLGGRARSGG